jgi:hypothetical protein
MPRTLQEEIAAVGAAPLLEDRARIVFDCRMTNDPAMMSFGESLHALRHTWRTVIECRHDFGEPR